MSKQLKMPQINNCCLSGRLVFDGEVKHGASGKDYSSNRIAIDEGFGEKKTSSFFRVVAFGKQAESMGTMRKGTPVYIEGRIRINKREKGDDVVEEAEITLYRIDALAWPDDAPQSEPDNVTQFKQPNDDIPF